jgi:hypothetical protein
MEGPSAILGVCGDKLEGILRLRRFSAALNVAAADD